MYPVTREEMEKRMRGTTPFKAARKRAVFRNTNMKLGERSCVIDRVSVVNGTITFIPEHIAGAGSQTVLAEDFNKIFGGWLDNEEARLTRNWRMADEIGTVWEQAHDEYDEFRMAQALATGSLEDAMAVVRDVQRRERETAQKEIDRLNENMDDLYSESYLCSCG